ncbi:putative phosphoinositide phospholipase C [Helianthus anomalus]
MPHMVVHLKLISRMIGCYEALGEESLHPIYLIFDCSNGSKLLKEILITIVLIIYSWMLMMNFWLCIHRTLTTLIQLIKCLKSIKNHDFIAFEYPVVITLQCKAAPVSNFAFVFFL